MLNLITKSEIRKRIILLFFYNPKDSFYINQIARLVKTSSGNVQRELKKLEESGILSKEKKGNLSYFKINTANPLFGDFKNIVDKTIGVKSILEITLAKAKDIDFAFLFGSYVKGDFAFDSDIDLYIIGNISEKELHQLIRRAEEKIYREINYHLATRKEFQEKMKESFFHKEVLRKFILIIGDKDEFEKFIR
jgi:predicted nucleotidyltransferase